MSFPGYIKSLKLKDKHSGKPESISRDQKSSSTKARVYEEASEERRSSSDTVEKVRSSTVAREAIRDERQNAPSKSLWVGNIPSRTTSSEIRELFCRFGNIVSTRIQLKYAFVNFEDMESAISAFKKYHDKDIFQTGNSTINIRFTSTLVEAKQAKEGIHERQDSMTTKAEAAQKQYFQPIEARTNESSPKLQPSNFDWPNGKPPTGPKSQRCEVSPPALRRGDSYRPAALSRGNSFRSDEYKASDTDEYRRGRSYRRHSSPRYSPTYSRSESRSSSRTCSSISSPKYARVQRDESPLPWERKESRTQSQHLVWTKDLIENPELPVLSFISEGDFTDPTPQRTKNDTKEIRDKKNEPFGRGLQVLQHNDDNESSLVGLIRDMADAPIEVSDVSCSLAPISQATQESKSPSLRPVERLRIGNESLRGTSVSSEVATTSSRTSSKRRRCHDCRKPASDLSPVIPCSNCKKRFHSSCGNPKPSSCTDKSQFVCGGCLQQRSGEGYALATAASSEIRLQGRTQGKVHLVSPPLSLNQDGNVSANLSPRDDLPYLLSNEKRLEAFFPQTSEDTSSSMKSATDETAETVPGNKHSDLKTYTHHVQLQASRSPPKSTSVAQISLEEGLQMKYKYKVVTCKWWASGNCTQPEEGCYYAHERTHISFPDRKKTNKSWTCYDWLSNRCKVTEQECRFAHNDTGLHVWRDGRPSFKHVTCFWWSKGSCKWDNESCKFAHEDTGLYSLDPADIWQGGSKFSITRPVESSNRSSLQHQSTDTSASTVDRPTATLTSSEPSSSQSQSLQSRRDDKSSSSISRPSLKVNTSTQYSPFLLPLTNTQTSVNPGTIGALPQTPNDDSPDKAASAEFRMPLSVNRLSQTVPDLPTPEIEDVFRLEQEHSSGKSCGSSGRTIDISINHDRVQPRSPRNQDPRLQEAQQYTRSSINPAMSSSITNQTRKMITNRSIDQSTNSAPRDPRLQNHSRSSSDVFDSCLEKSSISSDAGTIVAPPIVPGQMNDVSPVQNDMARPRSVGRCQKCQKPVFASLLCRVCSTTASTDNADLESAPTKPGETDAVSSTKEDIKNTGSKLLDPATDDCARTSSLVSATTATPAVKNNLKRSASGSNMFLKNKRPKSSMMFSSSGSIRPDSFSRPVANKRPSLVPVNLISRRAPQPSLSDLIQKERAKNTEKGDDILLDTSVLVESPISDHEQQNEPPDSPEHEPLVDIRTRPHTAKDDNSDESHLVEQHDTSVHGDIFSSPSQTPHKQNLDLQKELVAASSEVRLRPEAQKPQSIQMKSYLPTHWRSSESPQPEASVNKLSSTSETTSRPHPTERMNSPSGIENKIPSSSRGQKRSFSSRRSFSRDIAARSAGIKWASAITCAQCQKNHKKCLHDNFGALDAHKCREYVLSREGRPDTGRSRSEWNAILKSSELDPSSDDEEDLLDDEDAHTSGSEDEFTTAVGENEMLVDREHEEHKDLLDKFKQPLSPPVRPSPTKKSPIAVSKFFTRDSEEGWTAVDERAKKAALVRKGVMFESDSEDDDYLSDEFEGQSSRERFYDPLHVPPKVSRDLFEVAPELDHGHTVEAMLRLQSYQERPSRKQQWAELKSRQFQERREKFGNPHWEVNRKHQDVIVSALVERIVPPKNSEDRFAVGSVQIREEKMTFGEFLGVPKLPEICLMNDGERLGFRDGQKERDRVFGRTGRGLGKRTTDDEKWPVRAI